MRNVAQDLHLPDTCLFSSADALFYPVLPTEDCLLQRSSNRFREATACLVVLLALFFQTLAISMPKPSQLSLIAFIYAMACWVAEAAEIVGLQLRWQCRGEDVVALHRNREGGGVGATSAQLPFCLGSVRPCCKCAFNCALIDAKTA